MSPKEPTIPPQLRDEIQRRLSLGLPMPPGVTAVPAGHAPPPGTVPSGIVTPGLQGQPPPGTNSKAASNPIAEGLEGVKTMRQQGECNIPEESQKLNVQLQKLLGLDGDHSVAEAAMGKGLFAGLKMNKHCQHNLKVRTAVQFSGDEKLTAIQDKLKTAEKEMATAQKRIQEIAEEAQKLLIERWNYSVKTYGLNPDAHYYCIDEAKGRIEEIELECHNCSGGKEMIAARLSVEAYIKGITPEAPND